MPQRTDDIVTSILYGSRNNENNEEEVVDDGEEEEEELQSPKTDAKFKSNYDSTISGAKFEKDTEFDKRMLPTDMAISSAYWVFDLLPSARGDEPKKPSNIKVQTTGIFDEFTFKKPTVKDPDNPGQKKPSKKKATTSQQ